MIDFTQRAKEVTARLIDKAEEEEAHEVVQQKQARRCNLIPFPVVETQPFRSELTLERHPFFVVNSFKGDSFIYERKIEHPISKEQVVQRVVVGQTGSKGRRRYGVLKQVHQEFFYKLLKLWGEQGHPLDGKHGVIQATVYDIVTYLRGDDAAHHYHRVRDLLRDLSSIPIVLENAYGRHGLQDFEEFTLVNGVRWSVRKIDKETLRPKPGGTSKVKIYLSEIVTMGFLCKNIKPLLWQPYASLGGSGSGRRAELARLLYPILDYELSTKNQYHVNLTLITQRLGMASYARKGHRKRPFEAAIKALQGKLILGEKHCLHLSLREAADATDYVLVARRDTAHQLTLRGL